MEIELCGYKVQIDEEDYDRVRQYKWHVRSTDFRRCGKIYFIHSYKDNSGRSYKHSLHRMILGLELNDGWVCAHANGDTLDNRKCNLRKCTQKQNGINQRLSKSNKSGYKGVFYSKERDKFGTSIKYKGKNIFLGYFNTALEGHEAYCTASKKYHGEFGRTA